MSKLCPQHHPDESIVGRPDLEVLEYLNEVADEITSAEDGEFSDFGKPHEQILNVGPRGVTIECDETQEQHAALEAYVAAGVDPDEGDPPTFAITFKVTVAEGVPAGRLPFAFARDNGGDYGATVFIDFTGGSPGITPVTAPDAWSGEDGGIQMLVLDDAAPGVYTFSARFGVCAFT